jgi:protein subunit release factor B
MHFPEGLSLALQERATALGIRPEDTEEFFVRGPGKGGQRRNKRSTAVHLHHVPTGLIARSSQYREQHQNRLHAWEQLIATMEEERERMRQMNAYQHFLERKEHEHKPFYAKEHALHEKRHQKKKKERRQESAEHE